MEADPKAVRLFQKKYQKKEPMTTRERGFMIQAIMRRARIKKEGEDVQTRGTEEGT